VSLDECLPTFKRGAFETSVERPKKHATPQPLKMKAILYVETSGKSYPATQRYIPEDPSSQPAINFMFFFQYLFMPYAQPLVAYIAGILYPTPTETLSIKIASVSNQLRKFSCIVRAPQTRNLTARLNKVRGKCSVTECEDYGALRE
jgi:hypothetical protein